MSQAAEIVEGSVRPPAGRWTVDPGHAEIGFVGRHFGLTKVRGRFTNVDGRVVIDDELESSSVEVTIDMASVQSGDRSRDDHLRSADFFDVDHHPTATFRSTEVKVNGDNAAVVGDLTIKGVVRPVVLNVDYIGQTLDPWGNERAIFSATAQINREDWGLTWNMVLDAGGLLVSREIKLEIEVELIRQP